MSRFVPARDLDGAAVRILAAVDGARWVLVDVVKQRLFVWHGGEAVAVYETWDGDRVGTWPLNALDADGLTAAVAERTVRERLNAGHLQ